MIKGQKKEIEFDEANDWAGVEKEFGRLTANVPSKLYNKFMSIIKKKGSNLTAVINEFVKDYVKRDGR